MAVLDAKERNALPDSAFALPGRRFPVHDAEHARDALARASEEFNAGRLTKGEKTKVDAKAHEVLQHADYKAGWSEDHNK